MKKEPEITKHHPNQHDLGTYFTPTPVAEWISSRVLDILLELDKKPTFNLEELKESINSVEVDSVLDDIPESITLNDITRYIKRISSLENNYLKQKLDTLITNYNIKDLLDNYKYLNVNYKLIFI